MPIKGEHIVDLSWPLPAHLTFTDTLYPSMKVVHIHDYVMPNMGYQENLLPPKILEEGIDIEVITSTAVPEKFKEERNDFNSGIYNYKGVKYHRLNYLFKINSAGNIIMRGLLKKLNEIGPDIIQCRSLINTQAIKAARYCKQTDCQLYIDEHVDNGNFNLDSLFKSSSFHIFKILLFKYIDEEVELYLPVQQYSKEFLVDRFGIDEDRTELLPLGVDIQLFCPNEADRDKIRSKYRFPNDHKVIITAGNIDPRKDIEVLLDALNEIESEYNWTLLIVGRPSGPRGKAYMERIKDLVSEYGLSSNVIFKDFVPHDELSMYYNAADIGVWPGKLGITTVEAIGTGLPVIIPKSKATNYIVSNDNGSQFVRGDSESLKLEMEKYINSPKKIKSHSEKSVEHARNVLSWEAIANKNISIYNSE